MSPKLGSFTQKKLLKISNINLFCVLEVRTAAIAVSATD